MEETTHHLCLPHLLERWAVSSFLVGKVYNFYDVVERVVVSFVTVLATAAKSESNYFHVALKDTKKGV